MPVYMSSLIAFSSGQLEALADAEGMTGTASSSKRAATAAFADSNDNNSKRQRLEQWGAQVAASINGGSANPQGPKAPCIFCGRHHSLDQCRGLRNLIDEHKRLQLARRGGISKPSLHRGSSWRTNKSSQFSGRAYNGEGNGTADRGALLMGATVQLGAMDITAGAARSLGARTVCGSPLTLILALILTTSLRPSRGTMLLCVNLSKPTARPPTSSELQSPLPRARSLWSLLPPSAASS